VWQRFELQTMAHHACSTPHSDESALIKEAADWALSFRYDQPGEVERRAFECWHASSPAHGAAWERVQSVFQTFEQVPADIGKGALHALGRKQSRRRSLQLLGALLLAGPAGWLAWRQVPTWSADIATATGEQRNLALPDGSRLVLNTASAVDVAFTASERRLRLRAGEILIETKPDSNNVNRPFLVDTPCGVVQALGTRFSVRKLGEGICRVAVFEHAVALRSLIGDTRIVTAGEQADFGRSHIDETRPVDSAQALWENGMLLARDMRLADVIAELSRHRPGVLRCDPAVAELRVTGAISLKDTDAALRLLASNLSLQIELRTPYWVTVAPRG